MSPLFLMGVGNGGYSITAVPFVRKKKGFHSISFAKISVLDSYLIHRYIILKYRSLDLG